MKNYFLLAVLCALALTPAFAQKTLPPSLQPYAVNWNYTVVHSLHQAGFTMPTMSAPIVTPAVQSRSNPLQLDSTKTFYGYDLNIGGDSTPVFRTIYDYPQPSIKIEKTFQYENGDWQKNSRTIYFSDDQQRLTQIFASVFDPVSQTFQADSRVRMSPHGNSPTLLDSVIVEQWDTTIQAWKLLFSTANTFDDLERLAISYSTFDYFGDPLLLKDVYAYDANGDNTLIDTYAVFGGLEVPSARQELEYEAHLPILAITYLPDENEVYLPQGKVTTTYTAFGAPERVDQFEWDLDLDDWHTTEQHAYYYDNQHRLETNENTIIDQTGTEERERIAYAYREEENVAVESYFSWDGLAYNLTERTHYYYSEGTSAAPESNHETLRLSLLPNPSTGLIYLNFQESAFVRIYNPHGELVRSGTFQPEAAIDLRDLTAGLYFISVRSAGKVYSGRVVKQ